VNRLTLNRYSGPTKVIKLALDFAVLSAAYYVSFLLRFDGELAPQLSDGVTRSLACVLLIQYLCLAACKVPQLSWQYFSLLEVRRISFALVLANSILAFFIWDVEVFTRFLPAFHLELIPRGVILIDLLLAVAGVISLRVAVRLCLEWLDRKKRGTGGDVKVPTLLIGAGRAGAEVAKEIASHPELSIQPIGFLDDNLDNCGRVIHGIPVLGAVTDLAKLVRKYRAKQALITIGKPSGRHVRRILDLCKDTGIPTKIIPAIRDLLEGKLNLTAIREVAIEDLLHRDPIQLDIDAIADFAKSRIILITGAGGSIGSELCRTLCRFGGARLLLVEQAENNLFHIHRELTQNFAAIKTIPCLADICDSVRMAQIFSMYRPDIVFHAAAHKHVPMMEWNSGEAIKNNVVGTRTIADLAHRHCVKEFVMISTDKAVNPASVMGVSKRIAEIYIQAISQRSQTRFVAVRFGNVLGSNGSVIPIFKEQIARGGPITITHPDMARYFMTIPEACELVLQAATMGRGGEIFILNMGEPVKIVDLARDLVRLSGLSLNDIEIRYTGLRLGEKLYEELVLEDEVAQKTHHPKIFIGWIKSCKWEEINSAIDDLQAVADSSDAGRILQKLKSIVPEYQAAKLSFPARPEAEQEGAVALDGQTVKCDLPISPHRVAA
jgi:FlaA1/EpsC-like NDP-sugar epimerase